ncbi:MAG: leucyl aminopeptidase [Candidatus Latescibacteria bacterium]|nr:leucyl aminopeptidase [Candidatus Latescibacterota bacterium]
MIHSVLVRAAKGRVTEDAVVFPVFSEAKRLAALAARIDKGLDGAAAAVLASETFRGERGETRVVTVKRGRRWANAVVVGLGPRAKADAEEIADALGAAARSLYPLKLTAAALVVDQAVAKEAPVPVEFFVHAAIKGFVLATHDPSLGAGTTPTLRRLSIVTDIPARTLGGIVRRAHDLCGLVARVRDWVNTPANRMTPARLADECRKMCAEYDVACRVWSRADIERARMGAVLAVASGSREDPRFVVAHYNVEKKTLPLVCLVGKGVTFDSGGVSIKPWEKMHEMKGDMAGGAAVIAAIACAAASKLPVRVVGLVPCVENMPGGGAFRPGDVLTTSSGKTVEVLTTDAEGRLILADAVAYARSHYRPDLIVDVATLTGGVVVALGTRVAGLMGTSEDHVDAMRTAAERAGEPVWPLPLDDRYFAMVKGEISDYKNYAGRNASPVTGGAMIGAFAEGTPWVHLDIAGTAWNEGNGPSYQTRGATGYGVELLVRFLEIVAENR